jgi:hypothetical protein
VFWVIFCSPTSRKCDRAIVELISAIANFGFVDSLSTGVVVASIIIAIAKLELIKTHYTDFALIIIELSKIQSNQKIIVEQESAIEIVAILKKIESLKILLLNVTISQFY